MDNRLRRNEICVIGLPGCGFAFSSTRSCFIAYGFRQSTLEMTILRNLLEKRGIQTEEAGGSRAPGQNAFCAKICSKIIQSRFCIVLINNDEVGGKEIPNANVNMEYGLILGFNKYVIPFQRASQTLPFNVAGLDTIKYSNDTIENEAEKAIDLAIAATKQVIPATLPLNQILEAFAITKKALVNPLSTTADNTIFQMGQPLGFNLLNDFSGRNYIFFGNFTAYRPEAVLWRLQMLREILGGRRTRLDWDVSVGVVTEDQKKWACDVFDHLQIWVLVTSDEEKRLVQEELAKLPLGYTTQVFSVPDVQLEIEALTVIGP